MTLRPTGRRGAVAVGVFSIENAPNPNPNSNPNPIWVQKTSRG